MPELEHIGSVLIRAFKGLVESWEKGEDRGKGNETTSQTEIIEIEKF